MSSSQLSQLSTALCQENCWHRCGPDRVAPNGLALCTLKVVYPVLCTEHAITEGVWGHVLLAI